MRNLKLIALILIVAFLMLGITHWLFPNAHAAENGTVNQTSGGSYVVVKPLFPPPLEHPPTIKQGDTVWLNDTVDISTVTGWPADDGDYRIAYYGRYEDAFAPLGEPQYVIVLPGKTLSPNHPSQYHYYIDPAIFADKLGYLYQYRFNITADSSSNDIAFYVNGSWRPTYNANSNTTNSTYLPGHYEQPIPTPTPSFLPDNRVTAGYLVAKGDPLFIQGKTNCHYWLFGNNQGIYDNPSPVFTADQIQTLEIGKYTVVTQCPGPNTIYDAKYNVSDQMLIPGLYGQKPVSVYGMAPAVVFDKLQSMLAGSDDTMDVDVVTLQNPSVTISNLDDILMSNITMKDVRGYTNAKNGTVITITLDETKQTPRTIAGYTWNTTAIGMTYGDMRQYKIYIPIDYDNMVIGNHTITARTALGGVSYADFFVSVMPADSYRPNATLKYTTDRNPFIENLTTPTPPPPIIVTQTVTITIPVTPTNETVYEMQKKAVDVKWGEMLTAGTFYGLAALGGFIVLRFVYRVLKKRKWYRKVA